MALELVYRAEHRCKSKGAPAGAFPGPPPGAGLGREAAQNRRFPVLPPKNKNKNQITLLIALESVTMAQSKCVLSHRCAKNGHELVVEFVYGHGADYLQCSHKGVQHTSRNGLRIGPPG